MLKMKYETNTPPEISAILSITFPQDSTERHESASSATGGEAAGHAAQITFRDAYSALKALESNRGQLVWQNNTLSLTPMPTKDSSTAKQTTPSKKELRKPLSCAQVCT